MSISCEPPVIITPDADVWEIDTSAYADCRHFVDWDQFPAKTGPLKTSHVEIPQSQKDLKKMARDGTWGENRAVRAQAYNQITKNINCQIFTPTTTVYHNVSERLFGQSGLDDHPLPEFLECCPMPMYCLNARGETAVKKILICIGDQYPDITYCPTLPAVVALLMHFSEDEAECFERTCRLISCSEHHKTYIEQSFLSYEASGMTFGDLAKKYCQAGHKFITTHCENSSEFFSDWLMWIFGDLPFEYIIRVFDIFLLEGNKVLYRVALALLKQYKLHTEYEGQDVKNDIQEFVKNISNHVCVEKLLEKAFSIRLFSHKEIWLLHMANKKALSQSGITVMQPRQPAHMSIDITQFSSEIVTAHEMRTVWSWIPERYSLYPPVLLFSTLQHGYSLQRFYSHCEGMEPTVLLIKTTENQVCGAYLSTDWSERKKCCGQVCTFFGTGECFVFSIRPGHGEVPVGRSEETRDGEDRPAFPTLQTSILLLWRSSFPNPETSVFHYDLSSQQSLPVYKFPDRPSGRKPEPLISVPLCTTFPAAL
ncbi:TBC1 domain family member 24-like isoform X1 [Bufo bufo]|uniref:TBC1 domain family member 24-like isoform X1 n=1 Tax=Bufo bufo TaxID=8384 RepID=UPI001ABE15DA|nr:TBC1 domain family member 24-like isoform X1 [Bufo bufo]XP_040293461.1 TBC1 domain family member 24-like isoform X1 [Bufo bufo]